MFIFEPTNRNIRGCIMCSYFSIRPVYNLVITLVLQTNKENVKKVYRGTKTVPITNVWLNVDGVDTKSNNSAKTDKPKRTNVRTNDNSPKYFGRYKTIDY